MDIHYCIIYAEVNNDNTLGVVTLNQPQRELIEEILYKKLSGECAKLWKDKCFLKNLENVQGDERDVIFISTTFGKAPGANVVRQHFGPISGGGGWRRLNVLFTRARKRVEIFSSMRPEDVVDGDRISKGARTLRRYLDFAERGGVLEGNAGVDREPDSDFERAVIDVLETNDYTVKPQLGVAGFRIDIAVRNPNGDGDYLAAIECDGATYHSGFSVRDRDRIRQEILESKGWKGKIHRIWSTDWYLNRQGAIKRLLDFLEERKSVIALETPEQMDDFNYQPELSVADNYGGVRVGDQVVYEFPDDPAKKKQTVRIISGEGNPDEGTINERTPVAQAILGLALEEESEVEIPGQPIKTIKLLEISER